MTDEKTNEAVDDAALAIVPDPPRRRGLLRRIPRRLWWSVAVVMACGTVFSGSWWYSCGFRECPTAQQLRAWRPSEGGTLLDYRGELIAPLSQVKRQNVPLAQVSPRMQAAIVAVEDRRFYAHHGIDWYGFARAMVRNIGALGMREGGSTITMQLADHIFSSNRVTDSKIPRKLLEWRYAKLIERALDKPTILERYLNTIYLGNGVYGVEGASQDLFGKSVRDVTLAEAALLAGLPKAPSSYTPRRSLARATARRDVVLDVLEREHTASPAAIRAARATRIGKLPPEWEPPRRTDSWAIETVRAVLDSLRRVAAIPAGLNDGQLRVRSTFDKRAQFAAERAINDGAVRLDNEREWWQAERTAQTQTQGALVALDPNTGAIRALVGGRRVERKGFNRAIRSSRQPGSAFKPFVYAVALQAGNTTATMVNDEPITIGEGRDEWTPANFDDEYAGRVTLRDALRRSANGATVRISQQVGIPRIIAQARAMGITSELPNVPALALGAGNVTPLELTAAYAPLGNGGTRVTPYSVERIEDVFGRVLWTRPPAASVRAIDARDAFLVTSMLRSVVDAGTATSVRSAGIRGPVAGKTGTTNGGTDVWFVGYTPSLVASVWFGADEPMSLGDDATGGRLAAPVWARFIREGWHSPDKDVSWVPPAGLETKGIDIGTGKLASDWCGPSRREWFREGTAPTKSCESEVRIAALEDLVEPPDWHEPPVPPELNMPEIRMEGVEKALNVAIRSIGDRRTRAAAQRAIEELRRASEPGRRRRND